MTKELIDQILRDIGLEKLEFESDDTKREAMSKCSDTKKYIIK